MQENHVFLANIISIIIVLNPGHDNHNEAPSTFQVTVIPYAFSSVIKQLQAVQALEAKGLIVVVIDRLTIIKRGDGKNRSKLWHSRKIEQLD